MLSSSLPARIARALPSALLAAASLLSGTACAAQELSVSVLFGDNSVWQRDEPVRLRGRATPGAEVAFASDDLGEGSTRADDAGAWTLSLPPAPTGGPYAYRLESGRQSLDVGDVYVGDVFICSGQSNMEWPVDNTDDAARATALTDPLLHHLIIPHASVPEPEAEPAGHAFWQSAYPGRTEGFTAIGYYFAEELRRRRPELPVGLVNTSWGGSTIEAWLADAPAAEDDGELTRRNRARWDELRGLYPGAFAKTDRHLRPHAPDGDPVSVEGLWEGNGFPEVDGTMWFDREFTLSDRQLAALRSRQADQGDGAAAGTLSLGAIDDVDSTFVNGAFVGSMTQYDRPRRYAVPADALRVGTNRLSIWVRDGGGGGGFSGAGDSLYLDSGIGRVRLGDPGWRVRPEQISYDSLGSPNQTPRYLYNGMLEPLNGLKAKGVLWYQGESNATGAARAEDYADQIVALVEQFRSLAGQPQLPFVAVELPEWLSPVDEAYQVDGFWPPLRQSTRAILRLPATGTVVALGYGDAVDIHPRNKRPVSLLLAEEMSRLAYGSEGEPRNSWAAEIAEQGPATLVVRMSDVGPGGLRTADGELPRGFAVRDARGRWHPAAARVVAEDAILLVGPADERFTAVAYAWSNNPDEANLVNGYGRRVGSWRKGLAE